MKTFWSYVSAYIVMSLFIFAAFFSPGGMALSVDGFEWFATAGGIIENFVVVMAILSILVAGVVGAVMVVNENFWPDVADKAIEQKGSVQAAYDSQRFKPVVFGISVAYWCILIAAGWIFSVICFAVASGILNINRAAIRRVLKERLSEDAPDVLKKSALDDLK